jgi:hypothetical protein
MPTSAYPDELAKLLLANAPDKGLVERTWPRLLPLMRRAYGDEYPLAPGRIFDPARVAGIISTALCTRVDAVRFVSMSGKRPLEAIDADDLVTHLHLALDVNRKDAIAGVISSKIGRRFVREYFDELGGPLSEAVFTGNMLSFTSGDMRVHGIIMTGPMYLLFFTLAYVIAGDAKGVEEMLPLAELMTQAIPVGEPFGASLDAPATWIVLVK